MSEAWLTNDQTMNINKTVNYAKTGDWNEDQEKHYIVG